MIILIRTILASTFIFLISCNSHPKPIKADTIADSAARGGFVPFQHIVFDANTGGNFTTPSGSQIEISPNTFTGGKIDMAYNEALPKKTDYIKIDSTGKGIVFEPIAILNISFNNKINEGKAPLASLLSNIYSPNTYAFYFDEANKAWVEEAKCEVVFKPKAKSEYNVPPRPVKYDSAKAHFDLEINLNDYPELKAYNGINWQYAGHDSATDPDKNRWTFSETWRNISLSPTSDPAIYKITFTNDRTSFVTYANPVFKEKDYVDALKIFNASYDNYQKQLKKRLAKNGNEDISLDNLIYYKFPLTYSGKWQIASRVSSQNK